MAWIEVRDVKARILRGTGDSVSVIFYKDGDPVAPAGTVGVTIVRANGTQLASGSASGTGTGPYSLPLLSNQTADLDLLEATWVASIDGANHTLVTHHEIVGMHLFTEAQARVFDGGAMADQAAYPDEDLRKQRDRITDRLQEATGVSWIPRYGRAVVDGDNSAELLLPHQRILEIKSVSMGGVTFAPGDLADLASYDSGEVARVSGAPWTVGRRNIIVEYEHGYDRLIDGVDRVALLWLRHTLVESNVSGTLAIVSDEAGNTYRRAEHRPSGIYEIDDWIAEHDHRVPAIA